MFRLSYRPFALRVSLGIALIGGFSTATLAALHPAVAASVMAQVASLVTCTTATACVAGTNTSTGTAGVGVAGTSTNGYGLTGTSTNGLGLYAKSANNFAITGTSSTRIGVYGTSNGTASNSVGVYGQSPYIGVTGKTTTGNGYGVVGYTTSGNGVSGQASSGGVGVAGQSSAGLGMYASSGTGTALNAYSGSGIAVRADILGSGFSVVGTSDNGQGSGADFEGGRYGIVGRAQPSGFPLVLTDNSQNNVFYVNGTGDIYYAGNLQPFSRSANGTMISSYTAKSTQPTVEDTGSAQLTAGVATVLLEPIFAASIDKSTPYRVFITPDGDTRGLFVAVKTARGFVVRETQGGHSNLAFDYRIVATGQGLVGKRMTVQTAAAMPSAPLAPAVARPQLQVPSAPDLGTLAKSAHP